MQTTATRPNAIPNTNLQTDNLSWSKAELMVTDLVRAVEFWTDSMGLHLRHQDSETAELGTPHATLIVLHAGARRPVEREYLGMYHVAIGVPDQAEFSRLLARLITKGIPVAPTDHLASKSIYFSDPDGLELEIIFETPERFGRFGDLEQGLIMYDKDGAPHSGRAPLAVGTELAQVAGADLDADISEQAFLAHVHFKVDSLTAASHTFEGFGFTPHLMIPKFGFADMSAGGANAHRLAMNVWAGPNLSPAPNDMARMVRYVLQANDPEVIAKATGLSSNGTGLRGTDPAGIEINITPAVSTLTGAP